jgi:hypothetical protein
MYFMHFKRRLKKQVGVTLIWLANDTDILEVNYEQDRY